MCPLCAFHRWLRVAKTALCETVFTRRETCASMAAVGFKGGEFLWCFLKLTDERGELRLDRPLKSIFLDLTPNSSPPSGFVYWDGQEGIKGRFILQEKALENGHETMMLLMQWGARDGYHKRHALQFFPDLQAWVLVPDPAQLTASFASKFFSEIFCTFVYEDVWWSQTAPIHVNNSFTLMKPVLTTEQIEWCRMSDNSCRTTIAPPQPPPHQGTGRCGSGSNNRESPY